MKKTLFKGILIALICLIIGFVVGQFVQLPFIVNADGSGGNRNPVAKVRSNPVVVNPKVSSPQLVSWKIVTTKENKYVCPDNFLPIFPNIIFPGSGTKSDPFYLRFTVDAIVRDGSPFKPTPSLKGPMQEEYETYNLNTLIILNDDRIGENPRLTHHDGSDFMSVDYYQYGNDVKPKYIYYPSGLTAMDLLNYTPYLKEAEVVGAKIRKTPYENNPVLTDICAGPVGTNSGDNI